MNPVPLAFVAEGPSGSCAPTPTMARVVTSVVQEAETESAEFGHQVRSSLGWSLTNSLLGRLLNVVFGIVIARILVPNDYGLFAVGLTVLNVLQSFNELGTSRAVVLWRGDVREAARTATTLSVGASVLLYIMSFVAAPAIASSLGSSDATSVLRILGLSVIIDGLSSVPAAVLNREFLQGRRAVVDLVSMLVSGPLSVVLATRGHGAFSLAWGAVAGNLTACILVYGLSPIRPRPGWRAPDARRLLALGLPLTGASFILLAILNVDYLVVGNRLGPEALGLYLLAFNLSSWPVNMVSFAVQRVSIPAFNRLADDPDKLTQAFARSFRALCTVSLLAAVMLSLLARPLIEMIYGERWVPAVAALKWLAVMGAARVAISLCYDALVAIERPRRLVAVQVLWLSLLVPSLVLGATLDGIRGAAFVQAVVSAAIILPAHLLVLRGDSLRLRPVIVAVGRPVAGAACGAVVVMVGRSIFVSDVVLVLGVGGLGSAVTLLIATPRRDVRRAMARLGFRRGATVSVRPQS